MADLLTLAEYKSYAGIAQSDTQYDTQLASMLKAVSLAIRNYTDRSFNVTKVTETRSFEWDGTDYLDTDDFTAATAVAIGYPGSTTDVTLDATYQWRAEPYNGSVYYYIVLPGGGYGYPSGAMGFMYNLDVAAREGRLSSLPPMVKVTATWGWPSIPEDVKLAALWAMEDWGAGPAGAHAAGATSEAIEGYSVSWGAGRAGSGGATELLGLPNRSKDILALYQKVYA